MRRAPKTSPPDAASLHAAALAYLARFAATQAGLTAILQRKVDRWARLAEGEDAGRLAAQARAAIPDIVARLTRSGAVDDAAFAHTRARALARVGRSRRAIAAKLAQKGVPEALATGALPQDELAAALVHARKRRIGPWRKILADPEVRRRELASLARAGYTHAVARQALAMDQDVAEAMIASFRAAL